MIWALLLILIGGSWAKGYDLINDENTDYNKLDSLTLCKLITSIVRANRFVEGSLVSNFESGTILKILKALERNVIGNKRL
jgi:hypothetical protein